MMEKVKTLVIFLLIGVISYIFIVKESGDRYADAKSTSTEIDNYIDKEAESIQATSFNGNTKKPSIVTTKISKDINESHDHEHDHERVESICINFIEDDCVLDPKQNIMHFVYDNESNSLKVKTTDILLRSHNFYEVLSYQASNYGSSKGSQNFASYSQMLTSALNSSGNKVNLDGRGIKCSDDACGFSLTYYDNEDWNEFSKSFISGNKELGNLFVSHSATAPREVRLLFFPGDYSSIIK